jgi:hypothetical protein
MKREHVTRFQEQENVQSAQRFPLIFSNAKSLHCGVD